MTSALFGSPAYARPVWRGQQAKVCWVAHIAIRSRSVDKKELDKKAEDPMYGHNGKTDWDC